MEVAAEYHNNTYHNIIHVVDDTVLTVVYCVVSTICKYIIHLHNT